MIGHSPQVALDRGRDLVENVDRRKGFKTWLFSLTHFSRHCRDQGGKSVMTMEPRRGGFNQLPCQTNRHGTFGSGLIDGSGK